MMSSCSSIPLAKLYLDHTYEGLLSLTHGGDCRDCVVMHEPKASALAVIETVIGLTLGH